METQMITVFTDKKDLTLATLREWCDDGSIITNPDYQRDYIYDDSKASKLIESLLIGIPIPAIYLCEEPDSRYTVIDGQQRVTSLVRFLKNEFSLKNLTEVTQINRKFFKDLDKSLQRKLTSSSLNAICLKKESSYLKFEIFARLNQGAVSLNQQEMRNCVYHGSFNDMLEEIANDNGLLPSVFHGDNNRKTYQERILRFFALRQFTEYKSSISKTMNEYMKAHRDDDENQIANAKKLFTGTIDIVKQVLGERAFAAVERDSNNPLNKFSGSVYDSIIIPFSFFPKNNLIREADKIRTAIDEVKETDEQYREDTYTATGSRHRVVGRIMKIYNLLADIMGGYGNDEGSRCFSNAVKEKLYSKGYICDYCGNEILDINDSEVDHITPFSQGGDTVLSNAQLLHRHCNRAKYDSIIDNDEWERM